MPESLLTQMNAPGKRQALVSEAEKILDLEVADKSGLSGLAIKTAFKLVKGVRPGFIPDVIEYLLNDFLTQIDPVYQSAVAQGLQPGALLEKDRAKVASALLSVTDKKAASVNSELVKKTYEKLRPSAQKHVEAAAPRLAELLNHHALAG